MLHIVLHQPEIPPNTGNVIRLCANTGAALHLIEPLGFALDDRQLKRAGLDYHEYAALRVHASLDAALQSIAAMQAGARSASSDSMPCTATAQADAIHRADAHDARPADHASEPALRVFALSTRGTVRHDTPRYLDGDVFVFGSETRGLPQVVIDALPVERRLRLPMRPGNRSLNLSNAVAVVAFEAWRQLGFEGGA